MTICLRCGPVEHQPIPEDEAHCPCGSTCSECPCHNPKEKAMHNIKTRFQAWARRLQDTLSTGHR